MGDTMYCTEAEVKAVLLALAKETDEAPVVFVAFRQQKSRSLQRQVTFVIQTKVDNEALINKIIKASAMDGLAFRFAKSDITLQDTNLTVDFIFVEADISPNLAKV